MLKVRKKTKYTFKDAMFSRNLLNCWCLKGNCDRYDKKLCDINYQDSMNDIKRKLRKIINSALSGKLTQRNIAWLANEYSQISEDV